MNIKELYEGTEPKLPGAPSGIKVMTPAQFVAKAEDEKDEGPDEEVSEGSEERKQNRLWDMITDYEERAKKTQNDLKRDHLMKMARELRHKLKSSDDVNEAIDDEHFNTWLSQTKQQAVSQMRVHSKEEYLQKSEAYFQNAQMAEIERKKLDKSDPKHYELTKIAADNHDLAMYFEMLAGVLEPEQWFVDMMRSKHKGLENYMPVKGVDLGESKDDDHLKKLYSTINDDDWYEIDNDGKVVGVHGPRQKPEPKGDNKVVRGMTAKYKKLIKSWPGRIVKEATKLPAQTRELKGKELDDYFDRIRDRAKLKTDKYKLPYVHRNSVIKYYNEQGQKYDTDAIKKALLERPKKLLKQNEKMQHSNGESEQFFNIGFAALVGIALDENTNELVVVNTCPGAGSCKVECFAMKGGKIQFEGPWLSDGRILTFLLNDPDGFFNKLSQEISKEEKKAQKGQYRLTIRWHDAGDFFSPEYMDMAFKLAGNHPDTKFYAYTKIAKAVLAQKPSNFMINWSEGASSSQEKQIKFVDPKLEKTKNSRIIPTKLFYDLLKKDEKGNLVKTDDGAWQPRDAKALEELKQRLADAYNLPKASIIDYKEMLTKPEGKEGKWNVIIAPGEGDTSANRADVISTLLLRH